MRVGERCATALLNSKGTWESRGIPRWELVERIVASPCFVKSPRLCSFLIYICDLFLRGRADEINELNIGEALFDRPANYDPSADGIVRSHASRLRQRLDQYFSEEGAQEPIRLLIPKGGYMPVFEPRTLATPRRRPSLFRAVQIPSPPPVKDEPLTSTDGNFRSLWILSVALALACVAILYLLVHHGAAPGRRWLRSNIRCGENSLVRITPR